MNSELELLLTRTNPWLFAGESWAGHWRSRLPEPFVPRHQVDTGDGFPTDKVTLVIGPRQAGKSTWLWAGLEHLGPEVLLVNCEEPLFQAWCASPALFWGEVHDLVARPRVLLFEEVQHLEQAGLFLKGLVDLRPGCAVLATGSSSFHLLSRTRESLAGRARRVRLLPFSLAEVSQDLADRPPLARDREVRARFERMLLHGSYPEAWLAAEPTAVLSALVEGVVIRDASDLFRVDHPEAFRRLLKLMAGQIGNLVNRAEWAGICGISAKTIARYAAILEEAHVVRLLPPWVSGKRAELTGKPKVFFLDNGIRNAVLGRFAPLDQRDDRGALWENWVFTEITKHISPLLDSVGFWRTRSGAEVDFVVETGERRLGIEVKASASRRTLLSRSARSFIDAARPERFVVVHDGERCEQEFHGCPVLWTRPEEVGRLLAEA